MSAASPGAALGLSIAAGLALLAGSWWMLDRGEPHSRHFALSPQACNTECQIRQTDCILECDGNVACERKCTATGKACVERCKNGPDAGAGSGGAGGAAGSGGSAGRR